MPLSITLTLSPQQAIDAKTYTAAAAHQLRISDKNIALVRVVKRSVDARRGQLKVNLTLELYIDTEPQPAPLHFDYPSVEGKSEVAIIGAGPAGLFAALRLIELGIKPVIFERGKEVVERGKDIAQIQRGGQVNPDSNYAFGEGGAGTFSDGKLFTRSKKRGDYNKALQTLVFHGASDEILYEAHPHIGTDRLPRIIARIRQSILAAGGRIEFGSRVTRIIVRNGRAAALEVNGARADFGAIIVATGHSAHDIYRMLQSEGVALEAKPFAMGVRIEHPQQLINRIQYHSSYEMEFLPAASYSLVEQVAGRGVYSFCMCPGGFIVPAMTDAAESVVNGMSPSSRSSAFANSGFVTEIRTADFEHLRAEYGELAGLEFQHRLEMAARSQGGDSQKAPAQRVTDFVAARPSGSLPQCSYVPGITASRLDQWLPDFIGSSLREGIRLFDKRMRGYLCADAVVVGVESRTSTPVRIPRDRATLMHPSCDGLFPAGEGAGYAGGIISAALDGENIANAVAAYAKF